MEQLNIVGKRSGEGFVAHKARLVGALSRALADRVMLLDLTLGRRGLLGYLKALGGSNVVKVIPSNGSASGKQATDRRLKVICGANTSYLADSDWIGDKTPLTLCDVRVSPTNTVKPNVGVIELAEAIARVLPFTSTDENRKVLQCVLFEAKDGKLTLVGADGFRLAVVTLDYDDGEGIALIERGDLRGVANALRRAKRARVSFEDKALVIDTELIRYKWTTVVGKYPDWQGLIPTDFTCFAHFDTVEAIKAVSSLKALSDSKAYPVDLIIGEGKILMVNPDDKGGCEVSADTDGEAVKVRIDGQYLAEALHACEGMVEFKLSNGLSPMLFTVDGYQLVVMPMVTPEAQAEAKAKAEPSTEPEATDIYEVRDTTGEVPEPVSPVAEPVAHKGKRKASRAKQPVSAE